MRTFTPEIINTLSTVRKILLLWCLLLTPCFIFATAPIKIVVVSDTHVMAPELLVSDGTAWQEYLAGQRKLVDYGQTLFDEMLDRIKSELKPDLVLLTGDLSKDGEVVSHQHVVSKLDELRDAGIPVLVIPGNHDYGQNGNAVYYNGASTTPAETATPESIATLYKHYGYDDSSQRCGTTLTYAREPVDGLLVIGIDSGRDGVVTDATLDWIAQQTAAAYAAGKQVIAMMHYPLVPHFYGTDIFVATSVVNDYERVRNRLADAGIRVVLTGHFHTTDIAKDWNADFTKEIYDINTGSLISYPCDYRVLTINGDRSQLQVTTGHVSSVNAVTDFHEMAKNRLHTAVKQAVDARGTAYSIISPTAADAFVCHAEGDEHRSEDGADILERLLAAAALGKSFGVLDASRAELLTNMATSMLQDITQYGVEGRANQTDDLTLSINLPAVTLPSGITQQTATLSEVHSIYNFRGQRLQSADKGVYVVGGQKMVVGKQQFVLTK